MQQRIFSRISNIFQNALTLLRILFPFSRRISITSPDPDLTDEEYERVLKHAIYVEHPGKDCPCEYCLVQFP